jgi:hypothetical protein
MTNKRSDHPPPLLDNDFARTSRHLRFMKALFKIDDPGIELALLAVVEGLAEASPASGDTAPAVPGLTARRRHKTED